MYTESRTYSNGRIMTIATENGGVWSIKGDGAVRGSTGPGTSRTMARAKADVIAEAEPSGPWERTGLPKPGDTVPCDHEGCSGLAVCYRGPDPIRQGTSVGLTGDALYLRCDHGADHVEALEVYP